MIKRTYNYIEAQRAHKRPIILCYITSTMTRRVYGAKIPEDIVSGETGLWDGSVSAGDGGYFGLNLGIVDIQARVLSFGSISNKLALNTKDLLSSLSATEIGANVIEFDNADGYFSELLSEVGNESFINQDLEIRQGYSGLGYIDYISLAKGIITDEQLQNNKLTLTYVAITSSLYETYELPKSGQYSDPSSQNNPLPIVIGDMTENDGNVGLWKCPLIDVGNNVAAVACHPVLTVGNGNVVTVYDEGSLVDPGGYTFTDSGDYEGQGNIAYITFDEAVGDDITCSCKGAIDSNGDLITNPIEAIEYIKDLAGDTTLFEDTSKTLSVNHANLESYVCAGVIISDNSLAYHITNILTSFLGSWYINHADLLVITLDTDNLIKFNIAGVLAERYYVHSPVGHRTRNNLCNQVIANYAYSAEKVDRRYKSDVRAYYLYTDEGSDSLDSQSQTRYGIRKKTLNFDFCRNTANINTMQSYLVNQYKNPIWPISCQEFDFSNIHVEIGDYPLYSWEERVDENEFALKNQIARVLNTNWDLDNLTCTFQLYDTGEYYPSYPDVWDGIQTAGDGYTFGGDRDRRDLAA